MTEVDPTQKELETDTEFRRDLAAVLNRHSRENGSNTPDFILADYLLGCLEGFDRCASAREKWYGIRSIPAHGTIHLAAEGEDR